MSGTLFLKDNDKMDQDQSEKIQVVVKNVTGNGILLQNANGIDLKGDEIKEAEYFLQVEEQDPNVDVEQAHYVAIEGECTEAQAEEHLVSLEMVEDGQIIINKDVFLWDELCRICANVSDKVVPIFSGEGLKHDLCKKIQAHLPLKVSEDDSLPLQLCYNCAATLLAWHEMTENCLDAQQRLTELQNKLSTKNEDEVENNVNEGEEEGITDNGAEMETACEQEDQDVTETIEGNGLETMQMINESETDRSSTARDSAASFKDFRRRYKPSVPANTRKKSTKARTRATTSRTSNRVAKAKAKVSNEEESKADDSLLIKKEEQSDDDYFETEMKEEESSPAKSSKRPRKKQKLASPKNLECKQCGKVFRLRKSYDIHMRQHTGEKPFTCHICGKQFGQTGSLYYHLKHLHGGVKNHACDICGRCFAMKTAMEDHRRIHTGERPYICDVCGKTFKTKASLYIHSKIHTDEYPFNCSYCKKPFRWKQQMISHLTTHTGEKNHICDICNKGFGVKNELTRHRRTHSTDKPFTCQKCGLSFGQKRYLTNHNRTRHKVKSSDTT